MGLVRENFYGHEGITPPFGLVPAEAETAEERGYPDGDPQGSWTVKEIEAWAGAHDLELPDGLKQVKVDAAVEHAATLAENSDQPLDTTELSTSPDALDESDVGGDDTDTESKES